MISIYVFIFTRYSSHVLYKKGTYYRNVQPLSSTEMPSIQYPWLKIKKSKLYLKYQKNAKTEMVKYRFNKLFLSNNLIIISN